MTTRQFACVFLFRKHNFEETWRHLKLQVRLLRCKRCGFEIYSAEMEAVPVKEASA